MIWLHCCLVSLSAVQGLGYVGFVRVWLLVVNTRVTAFILAMWLVTEQKEACYYTVFMFSPLSGLLRILMATKGMLLCLQVQDMYMIVADVFLLLSLSLSLPT